MTNRTIIQFLKEYGIAVLIAVLALIGLYRLGAHLLEVDVVSCDFGNVEPGDRVSVFDKPYVVTKSVLYTNLGEFVIQGKEVK